MKEKNKRLIVGSIGGFLGAGIGAVAGSYDTWINMLVGAVCAAIIVLLVNGFIPDKE